MACDTRLRGGLFAGDLFLSDLLERHLEDHFQVFEGDLDVTGDGGLDDGADFRVQFEVLGLGICQTNPRFVSFLLTGGGFFIAFLRNKPISSFRL